MRQNLALVIVVLAAGCASANLDDYFEFDKPGPAVATREDCALLKGEWRRSGEMGAEMCHVPTKDAGKPCHDSSECESTCLAAEGVEYHQRTTGRCHNTYVTIGMCAARVHNGRAGATICTD